MNEMVPDLARRPGMFSDEPQINVDLLANHPQTFGARLTNVMFPMLFVYCIATATHSGLFSLESRLLKCDTQRVAITTIVGPNNTLEQYIIDDTVLPLVPFA